MDLDTLRPLLHEHRFRLTQEREMVLAAFVSAEEILTPTQLYDRVHAQHAHVGLTTVYRLLEVLTKLGLATPFLIDGEIFYTFCPQPHHHHFVCLACHHVRDIFECAQLPHDDAWGEVTFHRLDLYGRCGSCKTTAGSDILC